MATHEGVVVSSVPSRLPLPTLSPTTSVATEPASSSTYHQSPPSPSSPMKEPSQHNPDFFPPSPPTTGGKQSRAGSIQEYSVKPPRLTPPRQPYALPPPCQPKQVLQEDLKTPDNQVPRDPRLIRLTGVHPFNVEAPLKELYDEGFLTSENLHYVRNHGYVPTCLDDEIYDWAFTVEGMVEKPFTLSVRDLITAYDQVTYPVTLVCAGNRRKEQNMVRKSKGFSWGAAGLSTALWTGVPIGELIARARPKRGAKYVCFEGADKLPNGCYGTSVKLNWCLDPNKGILVAHKMNGEILHPDHGKPVRIVIPGQIGGRSVKWLKRIIITAQPSDNWYHIYDNRVLPTEVSPEASGDLPDTWKDERYAIYDLNANSAICYPAHDEKVSLLDGPSIYKVRGYAYGGGGKRITRMEVTLDKGKTWRLANIRYPEDDYREAPEGDTLYGGKLDMWWRETCFCWCFWELDIPIVELEGAADIMVRGMDEGLMVQPRDMYWSVLGMMNNPWFRVVIHKDAHSLRFEHPTQPALMPGGWMERVKKEGGNLSNGFWGEKVSGEEEPSAPEEAVEEVRLTNPEVKKLITFEEFKQHENDTNPWFVINGEVFDGTAFLEGHPGGAASIIGAAGQDATEEFLSIHSQNAKAMMPEYHVGTLDEAGTVSLQDGGAAEQELDPSREVFLQPKAWTKGILQKRVNVSSDTKIFTFKLNHEGQTVGLPTGQHLLMRLRDPVTREAIIRSYTPISEGTDRGTLDVLVKIYYDTADKMGGKMTQSLDAIPLGHFVDFKGPVGKFEYLGNGACTVSGRPRQIRRFIMVCAGSGITPIYQVLRAILKNPQDPTHCVLLDGNRVESDILLRSELDALAAANPDRCRLLYSLTKPEPSWSGRTGRMDKMLFESEVGPPSLNTNSSARDEMVLICGPEALERVTIDVFREMGWHQDDLLVF